MKRIKLLILAIAIVVQLIPCIAFANDKTVLSENEFIELMTGYLHYEVDSDGYIDVETFNPAQKEFFGGKAEWIEKIVSNDNI